MESHAAADPCKARLKPTLVVRFLRLEPISPSSRHAERDAPAPAAESPLQGVSFLGAKPSVAVSIGGRASTAVAHWWFVAGARINAVGKWQFHATHVR